MESGLLAAHRKWPTGVYALWYPLKDREGVSRFTTRLMASGLRKVDQVELVVDAAALGRGALGGCGMVLVNAPYGLREEVGTVLPVLAGLLGKLGPGAWHWRVLAGE